MNKVDLTNKVHYKYALIRDNNEVNLFNSSILYGDRNKDNYLVDVDVCIENGLLVILGYEHKWKTAEKRTPVEELEEKPDPNYVKHSKGVYIFGIELQKPYDYVLGHYAVPKSIPVCIIMNNYKIRIVE